MADAARQVVCFGELLLRLNAPGRELLLQSPRLDVHHGGAEANVAIALAHLGHRAHMVSIVPDNPLGHSAVAELRRHGVDVTGVAHGAGRMGLYFATRGAGLRPAEVIYDRGDSAFARIVPGAIDWPRRLQGAAWLHVSGITPAVSVNAATVCREAVESARAAGVAVSFDGNYRASVWAGRAVDAPAILRELLALADVAFVNEQDIALILGRTFSDPDPAANRRAAVHAAFESLPRLARICATVRRQHTIDDQALSATMHTRAKEWQSRTWPLTGIVDRIGAGDAFVAGMLHGLLIGGGDQATLEFATAAAALKHSVVGDCNPLSAAAINALVDGHGSDIRR